VTGADVIGNRLLAARARDIARQARLDPPVRRAALCLSVVLEETRTIAAARVLLDDLNAIGQGELHAPACKLLDLLTGRITE
jgi:hypothetical protein